jgi:hypothetical protein
MPDGASFRVLPNEAPARVVPASLPGRSVLSPGGSGNLLRLQNRARVESRCVAIADFNTSLVKKNFPSLGTIMICT